MTDPSRILKAALWYREKMAFSVIPVGHNKKCAIKKEKDESGGWELYQKERPNLEQIKEWWNGEYANCNVGIVTGEISNLTVVDVDSKNGSRVGFDAIRGITPDSMITPIAQSPSGGEHRYFLYENGTRNKVRFIPDCDIRSEGGYIIAPPSSNGRGSYTWKPGLSITEVPLISLPTQYIDALNYSNYIIGGGYRGGNPETDGGNTTEYYSDYKILQSGTRDNDLFKAGMALIDGGCPRWMIYQILEKLALSANPPFPLSGVDEKIKSILQRDNRKKRNLVEEVREWCLLQKGYFLTTEILQTLQLTTKAEKKYLTVIINRLQDDRIIEKYGEKRGCYRTIEKVSNSEMQFIEGDINEFNIKLPFGLNKICSIFPKNIIILAGSKSSGKTAMLMNIAKMNQDKHRVIYFNSEMGNEEWSRRLRNMGIEKKEDVKFKAYSLHKNFHDMMDNEKKIFIVDFLEIHDNFYEIAKWIRMIHEVIRDGICIIAIQKKQGQILARGADFSMEKSRLYLSLEFLDDQRCSRLTIVDAKSPKIPNSLRGWNRRIKIINGAEMESLDANWKPM